MEERPLNGKMTKHGKFTQVLTGCLRYFMRVSAGELNVLTHRASCVQACAPPEAVTVCKAGMITAYESRFRGITYSAIDPETATFASVGTTPDVSFATGFDGHAKKGANATGFPRDAGIHVVGDCTWGDRNVYGMLFMMNHGAIATDTKKMGPVDSSAEGEGITTSKCAELTVFIREVARGMGILDDKPTVIRSDNASSVRVANDPKAAGRLRHAMRRYSVLQEHVKQGTVRVEFIRDENNAADFLTKWVPAAKLKASIAYTSNEAAKPKKQGKTEISTLEVSMIEDEGTYMTLRSNKRKFPTPPPPVVPQPMPFIAAGTPAFFDWQAAFAGVQFDDEVPAEPIAASAAPEAPDPEPEQPDGPTAPTPPPQTTLADPKHFAHRLFADCAREQAGPSGSQGALPKSAGRLRHDMRRYGVLYGRSPSYEPLNDDELNAEFHGQDSDAQNSD
jgi:hypothetical protein